MLYEVITSRFERGLNVDLQPPNYETRYAILKKKVETNNLNIPPEVFDVIARNISTNVRDLEAALVKLNAYADLVITSYSIHYTKLYDHLGDRG